MAFKRDEIGDAFGTRDIKFLGFTSSFYKISTLQAKQSRYEVIG
jgi:hypothetical protein